ncbi:hypothetical protein SK571_31940 [Lentzea sp. BCCO 10_0798]|uniref:Uncharacterized protein n=1 Tax=Lentzea kristufekii TaxID=3095430 RepID=A0ABU4U0C0_9PSEU|nr:hypothetical protein [Lentzea sp. BCCO 10_0798]MDX8054005.1 hypothetical protein [Lentzea sp. BCCO 10_0798]
MSGDEEQVEEHVQVHEQCVNVLSGNVNGTVIQLGAVHGDLVFPAPKPAED